VKVEVRLCREDQRIEGRRREVWRDCGVDNGVAVGWGLLLGCDVLNWWWC